MSIFWPSALTFAAKFRTHAIFMKHLCGQVAERLMAADCKSALERVRRFESFPVHHFIFQGNPRKFKKSQ